VLLPFCVWRSVCVKPILQPLCTVSAAGSRGVSGRGLMASNQLQSGKPGKVLFYLSALRRSALHTTLAPIRVSQPQRRQGKEQSHEGSSRTNSCSKRTPGFYLYDTCIAWLAAPDIACQARVPRHSEAAANCLHTHNTKVLYSRLINNKNVRITQTVCLTRYAICKDSSIRREFYF